MFELQFKANKQILANFFDTENNHNQGARYFAQTKPVNAQDRKPGSEGFLRRFGSKKNRNFFFYFFCPELVHIRGYFCFHIRVYIGYVHKLFAMMECTS